MPTVSLPEEHYKDIDLLIPTLHAVTPDGALTVVDSNTANTVKPLPRKLFRC